MRVLPFVSVVTAIAARDWITAELIDGLICVHVAPASVERQIPRAQDDAYTMFGLDGSSTTCRTPRGEQIPAFANSVALPVQSATLVEPLWMNAHEAPPSVDLYRPHLAMPGMGRVTPEQQTDDIPPSAVVDPT